MVLPHGVSSGVVVDEFLHCHGGPVGGLTHTRCRRGGRARRPFGVGCGPIVLAPWLRGHRCIGPPACTRGGPTWSFGVGCGPIILAPWLRGHGCIGPPACTRGGPPWSFGVRRHALIRICGCGLPRPRPPGSLKGQGDETEQVTW